MNKENCALKLVDEIILHKYVQIHTAPSETNSPTHSSQQTALGKLLNTTESKHGP